MRRERGFTLVELVLAMALLATMLLLLYSGLSFALRSWDAGDTHGRRVTDRRIGENFLRREVSEVFPMRWKDPMVLKFAFEGEAGGMKFVSSRPAGLSNGGLSLVSLAVEDAKERGRRNLVMRRAMPDEQQKDFSALDAAEPLVLFAELEDVKFEYFGAETDFAEPKWEAKWPHQHRLPRLVRVQLRTSDGTAIPDMVLRVILGEEAGCLENSFQRVCRPRRPAP